MRAAGPHAPLSRPFSQPSVGIFAAKPFPGHAASRLRSLPGLFRRLPPPGEIRATVRAPMRDRQPSTLLRRRDPSSKPTPPPSAHPPRIETRSPPPCHHAQCDIASSQSKTRGSQSVLPSVDAGSGSSSTQAVRTPDADIKKETCAYADHMRTSSGRWMYQVQFRRGDSGIISCRSYRAFL